ncbi:phosphonoacetaldehyde hydrolase [Desulforhopalus singaporensis]|uniref:Phosphonoacetaldehyde hydrolase n=1 Tax=Desulforhopalus singaporensis TaxID=91360 RepID=A0A1H0TYT2_9BACT|nr:phosphonoacetaldehyde hydrolase [Desulforhopalus singaporensis]SDP58706.1 phosphonoacetaldehyde hydrolase [Desulforhopalus singaporensis]
MEYRYKRVYGGRVQLVVFDWAGTTVDFGCQAPVEAFVAGFRDKGVEVSVAAARIPMGMEKRDHIKAMAEFDEVAAAWKRVHGRAIGDRDIDILYDDFAGHLLNSIEAKSTLLNGVVEVAALLREDGVKIGASTGYFSDAAEIVVNKAGESGYKPDFAVCASDVEGGRPAPWMLYRVMEALQVYPPEAVINVGDTPVDMATGLNGGVWSVGIALTGNQMGVSEQELAALDPVEYKRRLGEARKSLYRAGAHYVIDTITEFPRVVAQINDCLARGERP